MSSETGAAAAAYSNTSHRGDEEKSEIPRWDGNVATWNEYEQKARWYVKGTRKEDRPLLAFRMAQRLTGSAYNQRS